MGGWWGIEVESCVFCSHFFLLLLLFQYRLQLLFIHRGQCAISLRQMSIKEFIKKEICEIARVNCHPIDRERAGFHCDGHENPRSTLSVV